MIEASKRIKNYRHASVWSSTTQHTVQLPVEISALSSVNIVTISDGFNLNMIIFTITSVGWAVIEM